MLTKPSRWAVPVRTDTLRGSVRSFGPSVRSVSGSKVRGSWHELPSDTLWLGTRGETERGRRVEGDGWSPWVRSEEHLSDPERILETL